MLRISLPETQRPERSWICQVLLGEFLGLDYELAFDHADTVRISAAGRTLRLPDAFFAGYTNPDARPRRWIVGCSGLDARLCEASVPVLFGAPGFTFDAGGNAALSLDVFGSAFFMLARYEESVSPARDGHGRFPANLSLAVRQGFLDRPIVDEYVEILWAAIHRVWPTLARKRRVARKLISCDVDMPFDPACASMSRLGKRLVGRAVRERSPGALLETARNYWAVRRGNQARDPYWHALSWMMDVNEKAGNQVTFNFIPERTDSTMDNAPGIDHMRMRELLRTVHARGHLIGIHPGYNTYRHPDAFARSAAALRRAIHQEGIRQDELGGRQHYLRWDVRNTPQLWASNGLTYDSTLSYPTIAGFRTGSCHEFTMYDLVGRRPLTVKQRPLVVMENAVIDAPNMGLGHGERALAAMRRYKQICARFDGNFTLLWHNSSFAGEDDRVMYCDLIQ
ncbi:polysaccharide deacetylase family protein [Massilia kyonggiensis]|nr:polysaccharide deacetylase family protein [Massilia kyonggiensis]